MTPWKSAIIVTAAAILSWSCTMANSAVPQPRPLDGMKEVPASAESKKLDQELTTFLRGKYSISSGRYYEVPQEIPIIAVFKSVQNQMAEKSIQRKMFEWHEPGIDFVEVYPQGQDGSAFAVAMPKGTKGNQVKLAGFYVLSTAAAAKQ